MCLYYRKPSIIPETLTHDSRDITQQNGHSGPKFDFRARLRKTNIDLSHEDLVGKESQENGQIRQFDFRHILKKTGRQTEIHT